jgi:limonene-1,2-epoxide hydrolase
MKRTWVNLVAVSALVLVACSPAAPPGDDRLEVANAMVQAWNERDWERVYALFAEDGVLHSVMLEPIEGRDAIRARLGELVGGIERIDLQVRNMGVVNEVVVLERTDEFVYNGRHSRIPVVGVMEIENGRVTEWREYYDHASLVEALSPEPRPRPETEAEIEKDIRALTVKLQADWNVGDMDAYLAAYWNSADTSLMFGDGGLRGWRAIHDLFTATWTTEEAMGDFVVHEMQVRFTGSDIVISSGSFEHVFLDRTVNGAFTHVWRQVEPGVWRIVHEHTSRRS